MKKLNFLSLILAAMMLGGCADGAEALTDTQPSETVASDDTSADVTSKNVGIESLAEHSAVISVTELDRTEVITNGYLAERSSSTLLYKMLYDSDGTKIVAEILLPDDYLEKSYPVILYFPDVKCTPESLCSMFAGEGVIVVRYCRRGADGSEGVKNICGEDYNDAEILLDIISGAVFGKNADIVTVGSAEGSIFAMKLAAERSDKLSGCAVIDIISDVAASIDEHPELAEFYKAYIGSTYEEAPEEYESRSAVYWADKIKMPILLAYYKDSPVISNAQTFALAEKLDEVGCTYELAEFEEISSDFVSAKPLKKLLDWVRTVS